MIINSYDVVMGSSRKSNSVYSKSTEEKRSQKGSKLSTTNYSEDVLSISEEAREFLAKNRSKSGFVDRERENDTYQVISKEQEEEEDFETKPETTAVSLKTTQMSSSASVSEFGNEKTIKLKTLLQLLKAIMGDKGKRNSKFFDDVFSKQMSELSEKVKSLKIDKSAEELKNSFNAQNTIRATNVWQVEKRESYFIKEEEVTAFSSTGFVKTADGRSISFNVDIEMSRSFEQYIEKRTSEEIVLTDPLVINLDSAPASISDQTFFFDIDADGEEDEISMLGKGSGFLALDKNGDGIINDGSEFFGALTGDGFSELALYDEDGNGWIDEADSIFSKLRVWTKDENGKDILLSLKEADLGAIYLNRVSTEFSVNNTETNEQNAQVRSTGVYLKESGGAGSIQQIDFAVKK